MDTTKPGYLIQFSKQSSMAGEVITINTNLPYGASELDIGNEIIKLGNALDARTRSLNDKVTERTAENLQEMGVDLDTMPGFEQYKK